MIVFLLNPSKSRIAELLHQPSVRVWANIDDVPNYAQSGTILSALERVDAIVLEITQTDPDVQYMLAQAIILQKPTLCLYVRNQEPREMLSHLSKKTIPKCIVVKCYTKNGLPEVINRFIESLDGTGPDEEIPNIKFTLRLTPTLDRYLEWLMRERNINKAEYMRELIKKHMDQDEKYHEQSL